MGSYREARKMAIQYVRESGDSRFIVEHPTAGWIVLRELPSHPCGEVTGVRYAGAGPIETWKAKAADGEGGDDGMDGIPQETLKARRLEVAEILWRRQRAGSLTAAQKAAMERLPRGMTLNLNTLQTEKTTPAEMRERRRRRLREDALIQMYAPQAWARLENTRIVREAMRAARPRAAPVDTPRNLPCPNCGEPNALTPADVTRGYQCDTCVERFEGRLDY